nr:hypothetical protein [Tanacetum cinerariifolium]
VSDCAADDYLNRKVLESVFYGQPIRNIVAVEGDERTGRHVTISVWRAFFARFGMLEVKLSDDGKMYPSSLFLPESLYNVTLSVDLRMERCTRLLCFCLKVCIM